MSAEIKTKIETLQDERRLLQTRLDKGVYKFPFERTMDAQRLKSIKSDLNVLLLGGQRSIDLT